MGDVSYTAPPKGLVWGRLDLELPRQGVGLATDGGGTTVTGRGQLVGGKCSDLGTPPGHPAGQPSRSCWHAAVRGPSSVAGLANSRRQTDGWTDRTGWTDGETENRL